MGEDAHHAHLQRRALVAHLLACVLNKEWEHATEKKKKNLVFTFLLISFFAQHKHPSVR